MGSSRATLPTVILCLALIAFCACGGNGSETPLLDPPDAPESGQWLPFPSAADGGASPYRLVSDGTRVVQGNAYTEAHGADNYELPATEDYVLVSGTGDKLAWAVYNVDALSVERPVVLEVTIHEAAAEPGGGEPLPLSCWIGVSDFSTYAWEWHGPFTETDSLTLNSEQVRDRYVSADHVMTFAVLTFTSPKFASGGNPHGLTAVLIDMAEIETRTAGGAGYYFTRPHFAEITEVSFGEEGKGASELDPSQYVNLHWEHVEDPADEDNEADEYLVYRRGPGTAPRQLIGSVAVPATLYTDPLDNDPGVEQPQPGVTYTYYLRAGNAAGFSGYDRVPVTIPDDAPVQDTIVITDYTVRVESASNGVGFDPELFNQEYDYGVIGANSATHLGLEWIEGTYNGLPFSGEDPQQWPAGMTQVDYDTACLAARDRLQWSISHGGAEECRRTGDWLVPDGGGFPLSGDPGSGMVFPDDDPQSTATEGEGGLGLYLPSEMEASYPQTAELSVRVFAPIAFAFVIDVEADPAAPMLLAYEDAGGEPYVFFHMEDSEIEVYIPLAWGVGGQPADLSALELELHGFEAPGGESLGAEIAFLYTAGDPGLGEFTVDTSSDEPVAVCLFAGSSLSALYSAFRLQADNIWSSINKPDKLVQTVDPPQYIELVTIPEHCWPDIDELQVFYSDPVVRRDPRVYYNFVSGSFMPEDPEAYNDVLKVNGDEFTLEVGSGYYPKVAVMETADPSLITSPEDGIPGVVAFLHCPHRINIDIQVLTIPGGPGDPTRVYSYRLFDLYDHVVGQDTFDVAPLGSFVTKPTGAAWGVNVWDREEGGIPDRDYGNKALDGSTIGGSEPDVLWFELTGGWFYDVEQDDRAVHAAYPIGDTENVLVGMVDSSSAAEMYLECSLRIVNIASGLSYIMLHTPTADAFVNEGVPGWPGIFEPDHTYDVQLEDPHFVGIDYEYAGALTVIGTNPNS